jgi:hypothetical protein
VQSDEGFAAITFAGLEEGALERDVDAALSEAAAALLKHFRSFDDDDAAKARLTITIEIKRVKRPTVAGKKLEGEFVDSMFAIKSDVKKSLPGRPQTLTVAIQDGTQLIMRATGTDETTPRQRVLATPDGRGVAPDGTVHEGVAVAVPSTAPRVKENIGHGR